MSLYLIAHKVRGEATYDVATQMEVPGYEDPWWIISTSGHRAYPFWSIPLGELEGDVGQGYFEAKLLECPADWPDHYRAAERRPAKPKAAKFADDLTLEDLGL